jgi:hypothetical protein
MDSRDEKGKRPLGQEAPFRVLRAQSPRPPVNWFQHAASRRSGSVLSLMLPGWVGASYTRRRSTAVIASFSLGDLASFRVEAFSTSPI